jgi:hypothetical protein
MSEDSEKKGSECWECYLQTAKECVSCTNPVLHMKTNVSTVGVKQ